MRAKLKWRSKARGEVKRLWEMELHMLSGEVVAARTISVREEQEQGPSTYLDHV